MQKVHVANLLSEQAKKIEKILTHEKVDILNIQMRAGELVPEHNANNVVVIVVRKGTVRFNVEGVDHILTNEDTLVMEPLEMHSLEAITDVDIIVLKIHV